MNCVTLRKRGRRVQYRSRNYEKKYKLTVKTNKKDNLTNGITAALSGGNY
jgi:hypothetical protein